jgi:1L-myo-inositol 1-phosphate cytidylyltransferase / CDP-L-myo-inositol myo-inositolphosphotransferase
MRTRTRVERAAGHDDAPIGVVLAAGRDGRMPNGSTALTVVAGRTLLERAVGTLRAAGIDEIVVVLGHGSEGLREFVEGRDELRVRPTSVGALAAEDRALPGVRTSGRRFLLMMVDHLVEPEAIRRLLRSDAPFVLGVDSRPRLSRVAEATKVGLEDGRVASISRDLANWDAVDAGLALCGPAVVEAAARSIARDETSWNAARGRWLAEGGAIDTVDVEGLFWIAVDTPEDRRRAERELVRLAARQPFDGPVFRYLNRRLSWRLSLPLLRLGVRPAAATVAAFVLALLAAGVLALGAASTPALVVGGLLVQLASVVDGVNGELARASLRTSPAGAFFDSVLDHVADAALLVALAIAAGLEPTTWIALTAALFGTLLGAYVNATYQAAYGGRPPRPLLRLSFGRDARLLVIALFAVALQPLWGLVAVGVLANVEAAQRLIAGGRGPS